MQLAAGESPLEWGSSLFVMTLESQEALFEFGQRGEVVWREDLSLKDGEVDLDLIEPASVNRCVDQDGVGPLRLQSVLGLLTAMGRAGIHDPEDTMRGFIGFLAHDLPDESIHRSNACFAFTTAEEFGAVDVPSGQVSPGALPKVLVLDSHGAIGSGRQGWLFPASSLDAGLFVRRDHEIIRVQGSALPNVFIEIENQTGLDSKMRIAREDPTAMLPGTKSIAAEPAPQRCAADLSYQALGDHMLADFSDGEPGQGEAQAVRQFTGECFYLDDESGGKSGLCACLEVRSQALASGPSKIACAIC